MDALLAGEEEGVAEEAVVAVAGSAVVDGYEVFVDGLVEVAFDYGGKGWGIDAVGKRARVV